MEVLSSHAWENDGLVMEEEVLKSDGEMDGDDTEEAPPVVRRKVSFADAFGLNLVSVKEFDKAEGEESETGTSPQGESTPLCEEYSLSCLFSLPSSAEELKQRVDTQMIELETIELLPGTTTIRGTITVANLCYTKAVYVRVSLDLWASYSDLQAEYVVGSSDQKTDRFTFKQTVAPPSDMDVARVEICLRYETPVGTFWANNNGMNYVFFCYKKVNTSERASKALKEGGTHAGKRSCLRPSRRSLEEKTKEANYTAAPAEAEATNKDEEARTKTTSRGEMRSLVSHKENKPLVDNLKGRRRHTRLAHAQEYFSQRSQRSPRPSSQDSASGQEFHQPLSNVQQDTCKCINKQQKTQSRECPKVLTYHEIPLLTLDWNSDRAHHSGAAGKDDPWPRSKRASSTADMVDVPPVMDAWETFLNVTEDGAGHETSVCKKWQTFLHESGCTKLSTVPESEWLQRAASVSPSENKKSPAKSTVSGEGRELQLDVDASAAAHRMRTTHVSDTCEGQLWRITSNPCNQYPAKSQIQEDATREDHSQRSVMNHQAGITEKSNTMGGTAATEDLIPSSSDCQKHSAGDRREEEIRGVKGKDDEPIALPTADLVTSSGEPGTTELTSLSDTQNGSTVDRIFQGASAGEGLSFSGEGQFAGTAHKETDDMLAFTETIGHGTQAEGLFVFSIPTQGLENGNVDNSGKSTREEIFMPHEKAEREISRRFERDETQHEQLRPCQSCANPAEWNDANGNKVCGAQSSADKFVLNKTCCNNFEQVKIEGTAFTSGIEIAGSVNLPACRMVEAEFSKSATKGSLICADDRTIWEFEEDKKFKSVNSLQSSQLDENISHVYGVHNQQLKQIRSKEELQTQDDQEASEVKPKQQGSGMKCEAGKGGLVFDETEEGKCLIRHSWGSREMQEVSRGDNGTFRTSPRSKCNSSPMAVAGIRWVHTQDNMKAGKEDIGRQRSPQEVAEEIDTSAELQRQSQTVKRTEGHKSHRGNNEKPSVRELKIEVPGDLTSDTGFPRGEGESVPTQFKEQEQPAGVKSSPHVESGKLSVGTKDPIMAGSAMALEVTEPTLEVRYVQRFGEDLVRAIWEEVFNLRVLATHQDPKAVDEMTAVLAAAPDVSRDCHLPPEDFDDTFNSGVYSLIELAPESSLEPAVVAQSDNLLPKERSPAPCLGARTHSHPKFEMNLNSSAQFDAVITPTSTGNGGQSSSLLAQGPLSAMENHAQIRERSVACQETGRQTQEWVSIYEEPPNRYNPTSRAALRSSSGTVKELSHLTWWTVFYIISHITRLIVCSLFVAGFYFALFLCDSTAFFALYMFSLCWWLYKLKGHQVTTAKGMDG